jgi:nitroreductase
MDYEGLLDLVKRRRSCRRFLPNPVSDDLIEKVINVARWAPSGANTQPWDFVIVKRDELRQKVAEFIEEQAPLTRKMDMTRRSSGNPLPRAEPGLLTAPVLIVLVGDPRTIDAYPVYSALQRGQSNLDASLANAFIYMHLAATSLGLGCGWISATRNYYVQVMTKELLGIPRELTIFDTMTLGYPASEPAARHVKTLDEVIHFEVYDIARFKPNVLVR